MSTEAVFGVASTLTSRSHHTKFSKENIKDCRHQHMKHLQRNSLINTGLELIST